MISRKVPRAGRNPCQGFPGRETSGAKPPPEAEKAEARPPSPIVSGADSDRKRAIRSFGIGTQKPDSAARQKDVIGKRPHRLIPFPIAVLKPVPIFARIAMTHSARD